MIITLCYQENNVRKAAVEHLALTELTQPIPSRNKTMSIFIVKI